MPPPWPVCSGQGGGFYLGGNMKVTCAWDNKYGDCKPAEWIIAWMCSRCEEENIFELCDMHYKAHVTRDGASPYSFTCSSCQGEVSYVTQAIHSDSTTEKLSRDL